VATTTDNSPRCGATCRSCNACPTITRSGRCGRWSMRSWLSCRPPSMRSIPVSAARRSPRSGCCAPCSCKRCTQRGLAKSEVGEVADETARMQRIRQCMARIGAVTTTTSSPRRAASTTGRGCGIRKSRQLILGRKEHVKGGSARTHCLVRLRGIELEITNAPLGLYSSSLAAPFSERALYPKA